MAVDKSLFFPLQLTKTASATWAAFLPFFMCCNEALRILGVWAFKLTHFQVRKFKCWYTLQKSSITLKQLFIYSLCLFIYLSLSLLPWGTYAFKKHCTTAKCFICWVYLKCQFCTITVNMLHVGWKDYMTALCFNNAYFIRIHIYIYH